MKYLFDLFLLYTYTLVFTKYLKNIYNLLVLMEHPNLKIKHETWGSHPDL